MIKQIVDVENDGVVRNFNNGNSEECKCEKGRQMKTKQLITLDDINSMICPDCNKTAEVVNCKENGMAMFNYGQMQLNAKNYKEAFRLFEKGADFGDPHCQHNLAVMLINGHGCRKDYKRAVRLLKKASKNGNERSFELIKVATEKGSKLAKEFFEKTEKGEEI